MTIRILSAFLTIAAASMGSYAQRSPVALGNRTDSVSYAVGADIGANIRRSKLGRMNADALSAGLRDGLDSTAVMDEATVREVVQAYMLEIQQARMEEDRVKHEANRVKGEGFLAKNGKRPGVTTTPSGLQYEVVTMGSGPKPLATDRVRVHYTGTLIDGTEFDSSVRRGHPAVFGVGQVIQGWVEGLQLMPVGVVSQIG